MSRRDRNTIYLEQARVVSNTIYAGDQFVLRLSAPRCAARARAGSFVHIQCSVELPMRRPLSIMRASADEGWIELLYKIVGAGLKDLADAEPGDSLSTLGPIGNGFRPRPTRPNVVLIGGGVGIPPMIFLAEQLHTDRSDWHSVAFFGSELPFPFTLVDSALPLAGMPAAASASLELMEGWGIPCRLASLADISGSYRGYVTDLAREWLATLDDEELQHTEIFACGPALMLRAAATLAQEYALPSQLCLEEYMACAVGGCAGCAVEIFTPDGPSMQRVCVDGPVFAGDSVYPK